MGGADTAKVETFKPYFVTSGDSDMSGIAYKIGNAVFFTINGVPKLNTTAEAYIRGLPYKPMANTNYIGSYWSSGVQCSTCTIMSDGTVYLRKTDTTILKYADIVNRVLFITGWYMTA